MAGAGAGGREEGTYRTLGNRHITLRGDGATPSAAIRVWGALPRGTKLVHCFTGLTDWGLTLPVLAKGLIHTFTGGFIRKGSEKITWMYQAHRGAGLPFSHSREEFKANLKPGALALRHLLRTNVNELPRRLRATKPTGEQLTRFKELARRAGPRAERTCENTTGAHEADCHPDHILQCYPFNRSDYIMDESLVLPYSPFYYFITSAPDVAARYIEMDSDGTGVSLKAAVHGILLPLLNTHVDRAGGTVQPIRLLQGADTAGLSRTEEYALHLAIFMMVQCSHVFLHADYAPTEAEGNKQRAVRAYHALAQQLSIALLDGTLIPLYQEARAAAIRQEAR